MKKIIILGIFIGWIILSTCAVAFGEREPLVYTEAEYKELEANNKIIVDKYNQLKTEYDELLKEKKGIETLISNATRNASILEEQHRILSLQYGLISKERDMIYNQAIASSAACFATGFLISLVFFMSKLRKMPRILDDEFADQMDGYNRESKILDRIINKGGILSMNIGNVRDKIYKIGKNKNEIKRTNNTTPVIRKEIRPKQEPTLEPSQKQKEEEFVMDEKMAEILGINEIHEKLGAIEKKIQNLEE